MTFLINSIELAEVETDIQFLIGNLMPTITTCDRLDGYSSW